MNTLRTFTTGSGAQGNFHSLPALAEQGFPNLSRLPVSIRIVLESLLRNNDGLKVSAKDITNLANYNAKTPGDYEIPFVVARIVLQDFTGVPLLVDLAAMRSAVDGMGLDPKMIEPLVPVDLVVDHSVQVDYAGTADSLEHNLDLEFHRNRERYEFLKWGEQAFDTFKVVPPGIGIVHQVNLEYLAKCVLEKNGVFYPDTLVGTDSHTTMINGLGVVGWGVGGIEAEAGMLGQPVTFLVPEVVGVYLTGALNTGVTATDLVLLVTEVLRKTKVVGKFVEFFGPGAKALSLPDRATIANMAPEYGATMASSASTKSPPATSPAPVALPNSSKPSKITTRPRTSGASPPSAMPSNSRKSSISTSPPSSPVSPARNARKTASTSTTSSSNGPNSSPPRSLTAASPKPRPRPLSSRSTARKA